MEDLLQEEGELINWFTIDSAIIVVQYNVWFELVSSWMHMLFNALQLHFDTHVILFQLRFIVA